MELREVGSRLVGVLWLCFWIAQMGVPWGLIGNPARRLQGWTQSGGPMSSSRHRLPQGSPQIPAGSQKGKEALHSSTKPEHRRQPRYRPGVAGGHRRAPERGRSALPGCGQERRPQGPATSGRQRRKRERGGDGIPSNTWSSGYHMRQAKASSVFQFDFPCSFNTGSKDLKH